jgi:acyl carrier protein
VVRRKGARPQEHTSSRLGLRGQLLAFLEGLNLERVGRLTDETSLIRSGLFDSMALFRLVEWIERQIGAPVDPSSIDLLREWDTVPGILAFIGGRRGAGASGANRKDRD